MRLTERDIEAVFAALEQNPFSRAGCHIIWEVALDDGEKPWAHANLLRRIEVNP